MDIKWQEGAVCFADGECWYESGDFSLVAHFSDGCGDPYSYDSLFDYPDFQLNEPREGWYIPKSELDTEEKYNQAVEVFGLFGFECKTSFESVEYKGYMIADGVGGLHSCRSNQIETNSRKITFIQLIVIGALKRLEIKRDNEPQFGKNEDGSMKLIKSNNSEKPNGCEDGGKYHREIIGLDGTKTTVDIYRILDAFKTDCAATDHAIKKMLCAGLRGHKDKLTDYDNAIESLQAAKELLIQKSNNENTN